MRVHLFALGTVAVVIAACSSGPSDGVEGGKCFPNGTCNSGLTCLSNLCVNAGSDGGSEAGVTDSGGSDVLADSSTTDASTTDASTTDASDGGAFDPLSLSGLAVWLISDKGVTATTNGVTKWADQTAAHNDFIPMGGQNPSVVNNAIAGHPGIDLTNNGIGGPCNQVGTGALLVEIVATKIANTVALVDGNETNSKALRLGSKNAMAYAGEYQNQTMTVVEEDTMATIADNAPHIVGVVLDGAGGITVRVDGSVAGSKTGASLDLGTFPSTIVGGVFAEMLVVTGSLSTQQINQLEGYLKTRYGL